MNAHSETKQLVEATCTAALAVREEDLNSIETSIDHAAQDDAILANRDSRIIAAFRRFWSEINELHRDQ